MKTLLLFAAGAFILSAGSAKAATPPSTSTTPTPAPGTDNTRRDVQTGLDVLSSAIHIAAGILNSRSGPTSGAPPKP